MPFTEGDTLIHSVHGPMRITHIGDRTVRGARTRYLKLDALNMRLSLSVPEHRALDTGLRAIASLDRIEALLRILRAPSGASISLWSKRIKDYRERLGTGDPEALCHVVREISRSGNKAPASTEGQLLRRAMTTLTTELSLALGVDLAQAEAIIVTSVQSEHHELPLSA